MGDGDIWILEFGIYKFCYCKGPLFPGLGLLPCDFKQTMMQMTLLYYIYVLHMYNNVHKDWIKEKYSDTFLHT